MDFLRKKKPKFVDLYAHNREKILNYINARVRIREDAEDLTEEVFEKVLKNLADFKWQGVSIEAWIYKIAKNTIIDHHRRGKKLKGQVDLDVVENQTKDETEVDPLLISISDEEQRKLYNAIGELTPDEQYLVYYKYFEELSVPDIAIRVNLSETNVSTKLHRLRKKLLKFLNKD